MYFTHASVWTPVTATASFSATALLVTKGGSMYSVMIEIYITGQFKFIKIDLCDFITLNL